MITVYCWNRGQTAGLWLSAEVLRERLDQLKASSDVYWIDLEDATEDEERLVFERFFRVHPLTLEDVRKPRREPDAGPHFPKAEEFPDYLFVVVNPLSRHLVGHVRTKPGSPHGDAPASAQLSAVLTANVLITHHYEPLDSVEHLRRFLNKHEAQADRGPDYLFHIVLDAMVDEYAPVLEHFDAALDDIEGQVFDRPRQELLLTLIQLKREIISLRKTLIYEREVLARLSRGEFDLIEDREMVYYRNVYDHLIRFTELIESSREMVSDLMQTHLAAASNKLNEVMKFLTMMSSIILPMTLIAGIYGMNFELNVWPDFKDSTWGFAGALGSMVLTGLVGFAFFRWKKWI